MCLIDYICNTLYLKTTLPAFINSNGEIDQVYLNKIEDISLQCYQEYRAIVNEFPIAIKEVNSLDVKMKFNLKNIVNELKDNSSEIEQNMQIALGNLEVHSFCLKIRNDLEKNSEVNLNRLNDLERDYQQLISYHEELKAALKKKQVWLDATFRFNSTIFKKKAVFVKNVVFRTNSTIRICIEILWFGLDSP